ncbi:hypothetical protein, partial [Microvirga makkahensis]|uniref:hypothetical protein n=1 Tax=Microvirga makkahensis TaxID=1128670 RepID=UPI00197C8901
MLGKRKHTRPDRVCFEQTELRLGLGLHAAVVFAGAAGTGGGHRRAARRGHRISARIAHRRL